MLLRVQELNPYVNNYIELVSQVSYSFLIIYYPYDIMWGQKLLSKLVLLDNTKALFKRGKAHMNVWNAEEAQKDLLRVAEIDPSLQGVIQSLLKQLDQSLKEKDSNLKQNIQGKLFSS